MSSERGRYVPRLLNPGSPGRMFYICDRETGQYLGRPARDGGFVRFTSEAGAQEYANLLNAGRGWPDEFWWGGA